MSNVSVPLRGLGSRKAKALLALCAISCFSPLAGIKFAESLEQLVQLKILECFSPLAGIKFAERQQATWKVFEVRRIRCFSPLAGIKFAESDRE